MIELTIKIVTKDDPRGIEVRVKGASHGGATAMEVELAMLIREAIYNANSQWQNLHPELIDKKNSSVKCFQRVTERKPPSNEA